MISLQTYWKQLAFVYFREQFAKDLLTEDDAINLIECSKFEYLDKEYCIMLDSSLGETIIYQLIAKNCKIISVEELIPELL